MADVTPDGTLRVACARGCGQLLDVDQQMVTNMLALGQPLRFEHAEGDCPAVAAAARAAELPDRRFRVQIVAYEIPVTPEGEPDVAVDDRAWYPDVDGVEVIGGIGHEVLAKTFAAAVNGPVTSWLGERTLPAGGGDPRMVSAWEKFQQQAAFADSVTAAEVPEAEPSDEDRVARARAGGLIVPGR